MVRFSRSPGDSYSPCTGCQIKAFSIICFFCSDPVFCTSQPSLRGPRNLIACLGGLEPSQPDVSTNNPTDVGIFPTARPHQSRNLNSIVKNRLFGWQGRGGIEPQPNPFCKRDSSLRKFGTLATVARSLSKSFGEFLHLKARSNVLLPKILRLSCSKSNPRSI